MNTLAVSLGTHDSAAVLIAEGRLWGVEFERISRRKYHTDHARLTAEFVANDIHFVPPDLKQATGAAVAYLLDAAGLSVDDIDLTGGISLPGAERDRTKPSHHENHAASAFWPSGFEDAAVLVIDNFGGRQPDDPHQRETVSFWHGRNGTLEPVQTWYSPAWSFRGVPDDFKTHGSLGLFYADCTLACGFKVLDGGKTMGLAPYGTDALDAKLRSFVDLRNDGSVVFDRRYQTFLADHLASTGGRFEDQADIAHGAQAVLEELVLWYAEQLHRRTGARRVCLAGGVALNSVANGRLRREGPFDDLFIQPAAKDSGLALGRVLGMHAASGGAAVDDRGYYIGREYGAEVAVAAARSDASLTVRELPEDALYDEVAGLLADGRFVAWHQGGAEFGPRSLGHRSILADPRGTGTKDALNARVKFREPFRPYAPSVLEERASEFFGLAAPAPWMLEVADVSTDQIPAVTHVDGSARVQTVSRARSPRYHRLIEAFGARTGVPVLLNTSLNVRGQPIVETPMQALETLRSTGLDDLVVGNWLIAKR